MVENPLSEEDWRRRDDARILVTAEKIKADPERLSAAKAAAKQMVEEEQKELSSLRKVAGSNINVSQSEKNTVVTKAKRFNLQQKKTVGRKSTFNIFKRI